MLLENWLPHDISEFPELDKYLKLKIIQDHSPLTKRHPFKHKHIFNWCILKNGVAVGWNENPNIGWSFPTKKLSKQMLNFYKL